MARCGSRNAPDQPGGRSFQVLRLFGLLALSARLVLVDEANQSGYGRAAVVPAGERLAGRRILHRVVWIEILLAIFRNDVVQAHGSALTDDEDALLIWEVSRLRRPASAIDVISPVCQSSVLCPLPGLWCLLRSASVLVNVRTMPQRPLPRRPGRTCAALIIGVVDISDPCSSRT